MKKRDFLSLGILIALIILPIVNIATGILNEYTLFIYLIIGILISYRLIGFRKNKSMIEKDVILSIMAYLIFYYLVTYILGYFTGFTRNPYSTEIIMIIKNTFPVIMGIISAEILRYIVNCRIKDNKLLLVLSFLVFTLIDNTLTISRLVIPNTTSMTIIQQVGLFILPSITTNLLMTYLTIKVGYKPAIVYRLIMELPLYIIPIMPKFGDYIESVLRITLPVIFFIWLYRRVEKSKVKKIVIIEKKKILNLFRINVLLFCAILVYLISGLFKYQALVIATGSMIPTINIGDVVIVDKIEGDELKQLELGEVIAYRKNNIVICHRIVDKIESGDEVFYETKGDNNPSEDQLLVEESQIVGLVKFKISYIGYPTVVLNDFR